jgi:hypothetical protein
MRSDGGSDIKSRDLSDALAKWVFVAFVVVAAPLILFRLGRFHWFFSDDWFFLVEGRVGSAKDLFQPHNAHWTTLPFIEYRMLWHVAGLKSYLPYQAVLIGVHLSVVAALRAIALRIGVRPWIATAMAGALVLFGPGADDIVWAIEITFTAAAAFGLAQLLLTDHGGPFDRRDVIALVAGLFAIMCSGVGVAMVIIVGIAVLLRRGWKIAAVQTLPIAIVYLTYQFIEHPQVESPLGRPRIGVVWRWLVDAEISIFEGLGRYAAVEIALVVLLILGFSLAWFAPATPGTLAERRRRLAMPTALLIGGVVFSAITVQGRWQFGPNEARASRYVYLGAAFTLPALAVAAEELARRRRELVVVGIGLLIIAIPANAAGFDNSVFNRAYFDQQRRVILTAPRVPFADQLPPALQPLVNPFIPPRLDMGFLLQAQKEGRLPSAPRPLSASTVDEYRVRLGLAQEATAVAPTACHDEAGPLFADPKIGGTLRFTTPVAISLVDGNRATPVLHYLPRNGQLLVVQLADLHLRLAPSGSARSFTMCDPP